MKIIFNGYIYCWKDYQLLDNEDFIVEFKYTEFFQDKFYKWKNINHTTTLSASWDNIQYS